MEYEWDKVKHESNLLKHGLDFSDADLVFEHPDKLTVESPNCAGNALEGCCSGRKRHGYLNVDLHLPTAMGSCDLVAQSEPTEKENVR